MSRVIVNIRDGVSQEDAIRCVLRVIEDGRVSKDGKSYCFHSTFILAGVNKTTRTEVAAYLTKKGNDSFDVWKGTEVVG